MAQLVECLWILAQVRSSGLELGTALGVKPTLKKRKEKKKKMGVMIISQRSQRLIEVTHVFNKSWLFDKTCLISLTRVLGQSLFLFGTIS